MEAFSFSDLGMKISVGIGQPADGALGQADPATGRITLLEGDTQLGHVTILAHEMMHLAESSMRAHGLLKGEIDHEFIHAAAFGVAIALARAGALAGVGPDDVAAFMETADASPPTPEGEGGE